MKYHSLLINNKTKHKSDILYDLLICQIKIIFIPLKIFHAPYNFSCPLKQNVAEKSSWKLDFKKWYYTWVCTVIVFL